MLFLLLLVVVVLLLRYILLFRISIFEDAEAGFRYANSSWPVRLLRAPADMPRDGAPVPTQRKKGTGTNEDAYKPDRDSLLQAVSTFWAGKGCAAQRTVPLYPIDIEGVLDCIPNRTQCGGDNRDAAYFSDYETYYRLRPSLVESDDKTAAAAAAAAREVSFLVVAGVNHNMSGKATYGNMVVETSPVEGGVFNMSCDGKVGTNSKSYGGTAALYAPSLQHVDSLYAVAVSRDCAALSALAAMLPGFASSFGNGSVLAGESIFQESRSSEGFAEGAEEGGAEEAKFQCLEVTDSMLSRHDTLRVVTRAYLEPETTTGPSYDELASPSVIEFSC